MNECNATYETFYVRPIKFNRVLFYVVQKTAI